MRLKRHKVRGHRAIAPFCRVGGIVDDRYSARVRSSDCLRKVIVRQCLNLKFAALDPMLAYRHGATNVRARAQQAERGRVLRPDVQPVSAARGGSALCWFRVHPAQPACCHGQAGIHRLLRADGPRVPGQEGGVQADDR